MVLIKVEGSSPLATLWPQPIPALAVRDVLRTSLQMKLSLLPISLYFK